MSSRPIIGVAMQSQGPTETERSPSWSMNQACGVALGTVGALPWPIPLLPGEERFLRVLYDHLDGLFVMGGADVDPGAYGEERCPACGPSDPVRDWTELLLLRWALQDGMPILAVCRGSQILNVAAGGTLYQDLPSQHPSKVVHNRSAPRPKHADEVAMHEVELAGGSRLRHLLKADHALVNTTHHQGVKTVGAGLKAAAHAPDGLIEGIEGTGAALVLGVQWHPEDLITTQPAMASLFQALVEAAREFRRQRPPSR